MIRATSWAAAGAYAPREMLGCKGFRLGGGAGSELGRNGQRQARAVGGARVARIPAKRWPARTKLETAGSVFVFIGRFATLLSGGKGGHPINSKITWHRVAVLVGSP